MGLDIKYNNPKCSSNGDSSISRNVKLKGESIMLNFVIRTPEDLDKARNKSYKLLVP